MAELAARLVLSRRAQVEEPTGESRERARPTRLAGVKCCVNSHAAPAVDSQCPDPASRPDGSEGGRGRECRSHCQRGDIATDFLKDGERRSGQKAESGHLPPLGVNAVGAQRSLVLTLPPPPPIYQSLPGGTASGPRRRVGASWWLLWSAPVCVSPSDKCGHRAVNMTADSAFQTRFEWSSDEHDSD
ncbi:hypothetical protein AAFF_G00006110 [Aldrovandia affinis]|uniref:Uncharacterized protein n=1 Tax=Aldrovandia affinis TaxID=143900 RepID=A0AAD7X3N3_9TELE|nr:hypothetical protein AAFF_G00006110 [Aldrovandia affinis]